MLLLLSIYLQQFNQFVVIAAIVHFIVDCKLIIVVNGVIVVVAAVDIVVVFVMKV